MRLFFALIIFLHGLIHFLGFMNQWKIRKIKELSGKNIILLSENMNKTVGIFWLLAGLFLIASGLLYLIKKEWWWVIALIAVIPSQALIVLYWHAAKWGTIANVIILIISLIAFAAWNFNKKINKEVEDLYVTQSINPGIITNDMLAHLPQPVQLWLNRSGVVGKEKIYAVRLKQKGLMRTKPEQQNWFEARAEQYFSIEEPAFVWKVEMNMIPFLPVRGRDKWVEGKGAINIKLLSLINVANEADKKIDQGALQRWLAEMSWFPSAGLSPYIHWEALGAFSAKATMHYKGVSGSIIFDFNKEGDMIACYADRYMGGGKNAGLEKWQVVAKEHAFMDGFRIPVRLEATWKLKSGDFTWYKLEITGVEYNKPYLYQYQKRSAAKF